MDIKTIVKNNTANFSHYRSGIAYYEVSVEGVKYSFPVNVDDLGGATIFRQHKAIELMRYIRKALTSETFVRAG